MSNRQARREQARTARTQRAQRTAQRPASRRQQQPSLGGGGGGLPDWLSPGFLAIAGLVIIVLGGIVVWMLMNPDDNAEEGELSIPAALEAHKSALPLDMANGTKLGSDSAPVKISMFEDFQCPFCLAYSALREPNIVDEYVKTGKVQLIFENYPLLGLESTRAALAGECAAAQNKFWAFQNKLFQVQADAGQHNSEKLNVGRFSDDNLRKYAVEVGADGAQYDICMRSDAALQSVQDDQARAKALGLGGTPSFLLNDRPLGGSPGTDDEWRRVLDAAVASAGAVTPTPGASPTPVAGSTGAAASPTANATAVPTATRAP